MKKCSCQKHKKAHHQATVAGLEDANWTELGFTILGGIAGQLVNGALGQIEKLNDKHGAKAAIKAAASLGLIGFAEGDWSTPVGSGMLVETGVTFLKDSDVLAGVNGVGKVYEY